MKRKNHRGRKYGQLTMLSYSRPGGGSIGAVWLAQCDCGVVLEVIASEVARGKKSKCGNHEKGLGIRAGHSVITRGLPVGHRTSFATLVKPFLRNGRTVGITPEDYIAIISKRCICCNTQGVFARLADPKGPLVPENLVPICLRCDTYRGSLRISTFIDYIIRTASNINSRLSDLY